MTDVILHEKELSNSAYSHIINAPLTHIDIATWLFNLSEPKYQRCCPLDHISCGTTSMDDGKRMSINVYARSTCALHIAELDTGR